VPVLRRKLVREVISAGALLMTIGAIMAVGVSCYVALSAAYGNLNEALSRYYAQCRMADLWIDVQKAPLASLDDLAALPGITEVRPRIQARLTLDLEGVERPVNGQVISMPSRPSRVINNILILRGSYFSLERDEEVILNDKFARARGIYPGQQIAVILNNRRQELSVVGTAISSEFVYTLGPGGLAPDPENTAILYLKHDFMEEVFDMDGAYNQVVGLLAPDARDHPQATLDRAERLLDEYGVITVIGRKDQASNSVISNEVQGLGVFSVFLPTIFLGVAALVLSVLLLRLIDQQRTIIGTLKAMGLTNAEIVWHYMQFGLVVGLIGGLIGIFLGNLLAALITNTLYKMLFEFPDLENRFRPSVYAMGLGISLVFSGLATLQAVRRVLKLEPAEAMRPKPPRQGGAILLERIGWLWRALDTGWRMVFRNLFRNWIRSLIGVLSVALATALVTNILLADHAIIYLIDFQFEKVTASDFDLNFKDERGLDALEEVRHLPGVDEAEPMYSMACTIEFGHRSKRTGITGLIQDSRLTVPRDASGARIELPASGLVMGAALADNLGVEPGDTVRVRPVKGDRAWHSVQVVRVADGYLGLSCYADIDFLARMLDTEPVINGVQIKVNPDPAVRSRFFREVKAIPALEAYTAREEIIENIQETFLGAVTAQITIVILFSGAILFGSTLNAALIALAEREREVATMLVLGYTPGSISRLFYRESVLIHLAGTLVGLPLGFLLLTQVAEAFSSDLVRIPLMFPPVVGVIVVVISMVFHTLAHAVVHRRITRLDWQESLKVKE
jgi:putative ABC transport system permease protein